MSKSEIEIKTTSTEPTEAPDLQETKDLTHQAEEAAYQATQAKETAENVKVETEEVKDEAETLLQETRQEVKQATSFNEFAIKEVKDVLELQYRKLETMEKLFSDVTAAMNITMKEMNVTMDLVQQQIGDLDEIATKLTKATAALVKLHLEQNNE